ncbi:MAG: LapA family protein, partial [Proteobacteria bacterium]|nr:LapA family protein [Pseudomonadota bacterium]
PAACCGEPMAGFPKGRRSPLVEGGVNAPPENASVQGGRRSPCREFTYRRKIPGPPGQKNLSGGLRVTKIIFIILFIILGAIFCTLNRQEISLGYFFGWRTGSFPFFLLILGSLIAGMLVGFSIGWGERRKLRAKARDLGEQVKALQEEVEPPPSKEENLESSTISPEAPKPPLV